MNNKEIARLWVQGNKDSAKGSNFFFEGDTIYSYGKHFPIAKRVKIEGQDVILYNPNKYSQSTTRHQSLVRQAVGIPYYGMVFHIPVSDWDKIIEMDSMEYLKNYH